MSVAEAIWALIIAKSGIGVLAGAASWEGSGSAPIGFLGAGEPPVGLTSLASLEDVWLCAEHAVIAEATWAALPADGADAVVAAAALWIAEASIIFFVLTASVDWAPDAASSCICPACFCVFSGLSESECIVDVVLEGGCLSAGCKGSREDDLS